MMVDELIEKLVQDLDERPRSRRELLRKLDRIRGRVYELNMLSNKLKRQAIRGEIEDLAEELRQIEASLMLCFGAEMVIENRLNGKPAPIRRVLNRQAV